MASNLAKKRAVERYQAGDKLAAIASEAGVGVPCVSRWAKEAGCTPRRTSSIDSYRYDYSRRKGLAPIEARSEGDE